MIYNFFITLASLALGGIVLILIASLCGSKKKKCDKQNKKKIKSLRDATICTAVFGTACIIAIVGILIWYFPIHNESKNYNLMTIEKGELPEKQTAVEDDYIQLDDIKMHYIKYGTKGHDVILIHGNGGSCESLKGLATYLANDYTVYCVDDRCQGKSSDPGVITYELMAKDISEFITTKGLDKPYIMGHSDGGMVGIALASNYPDSIGALLSCGSNSNPATFKWFFTFGVQYNNIRHPDKLNNLMLTEPDFTPEYLSRITVPTYIVAGEFDIMPLSDSVYIHNNIQGSQIAIMEWGDHGSYFGDDCQDIYFFTYDFFKSVENGK